LVIAGGEGQAEVLARRMAQLAASMKPGRHCVTDPFQRNVRLTDAGIARVERHEAIGNLYAQENLHILAAIEEDAKLSLST